MRKHWVGKNIDLALVSECVEVFFKERGFKTRKEHSIDEYVISWVSPQAKDMRQAMKVRVYGYPNDFWIEFTNGTRAHRSILHGFATTLFGGGALILRGIKLREALEAIERGFWVYIEEAVSC
jgi:hypothetical protein